MRFLTIALVVLSTVFSTGCVIDQEQSTYGTHPLALSGVTNQILAQTVTAGTDGGLVSVKVVVYCNTSPADVTLQIRGTTSNLPNDTIFATKTVNVPVRQSSTPPMIEFKLDDPVYFAANSLYAFSLSSAANCGVYDSADGDIYLLGKGYFKNDNTSGNWSCLCSFPPRGFDLVFQTKVNTAIPGSATFEATGLASDPPAPITCVGPACSPEASSRH